MEKMKGSQRSRARRLEWQREEFGMVEEVKREGSGRDRLGFRIEEIRGDVWDGNEFLLTSQPLLFV